MSLWQLIIMIAFAARTAWRLWFMKIFWKWYWSSVKK